MTYVVTARSWRPQVFADLVGQEHISRTLSNAIRADRVAHAFLFTGLRGVGKTTAARILAKALNCEKGPSPEPCNRCTNCVEITDGRSVDVLEIDGASNTGVDDVREIIENVRYQPAKSAYKIYIIDEVHMLSNSAFNALLKTLEEPPPHVKFVFATTDPQKLPATVQSRCQRYDFRRIPLGLIVERLRAIAKKQKVKISDQVLFTLAREGEGSMRDAQSLLDQITAGASGAISDEDALAALGIADRSVVYDLGAAIVGRDPQRALEVLDGVHRLGCDMRRLTRDLLEHMRNLTVAHVSSGKLLPELPQEEVETLREQAKGIEPADADRCFRLLLQTDDEVGRSAYPKLVLEMAVLRLATLEPLVPVAELLQRIEALDGGGRAVPPATSGRPQASRGRATTSPRGGAPEAVEVSSAEPARAEAAPAGDASWGGFKEFVKSKAPAMGAHLATCSNADLGDKVLTIEAPAGFRANYLKDAAHTATMERLAGEFFGRPLRVLIQDLASEVGPEEAAPEATPAERAEAVLKHPAVKAAIDILDGELAEVRQRRPRKRGGMQ
jgi:DNA polymerase-3 subunit gamma/tau